MNNIWIAIISGILIIIGTLGSILPFLPGLPVAWLGLLIYAWYTSFDIITVWGLVVFGALVGLTILVDVIAPAIAARGRNASKMGIIGALIGGFVGIAIMGPIGILVGPFVGAFIGEMMTHQNPEHSFRIALASMFGLVIGSAFKLVVGTSMFIYFLVNII